MIHISASRPTEIRARSTIDAFDRLGYTLLFSYKEVEALDIYQAMPDLVKVVILDTSLILNCLYYNRPRRVYSQDISAKRFRRVVETERLSWNLSEPGQDDGLLWGIAEHIEGREYQPDCIRRRGFEGGIPIWKTLAYVRDCDLRI